MQTLTTTALPADEPVTLAQAKTHLRIDHDDEDALIQHWIKAAREYAETHISRRFVTQTITVKLDCWPDGINEPDWGYLGGYGAIRLEGFGPGDLSTVGGDTVITYYDSNGTQQTLSSTLYQTDYTDNPPVIAPIPNGSWPLVQVGKLKPISISVKAGVSQVSVPAAIKQAILLTLTYWDENRGGEPMETVSMRGLPAGALRLLNSQWTGGYV